MKNNKIIKIALILSLILGGCAKRSMIPYEQVEKTNYVFVKLTTGETIRGTAVKSEPHQIVVLLKNGEERVIPKSTVRTIHRNPPVYDDFGRGISEEEIKAVTSVNGEYSLYDYLYKFDYPLIQSYDIRKDGAVYVD